MASITTIDDGKDGALVGLDLDLLQRWGQSVALVRVAGEAAHAHDEALILGCGTADLAAKLVSYPRFALRDAVDLGLVQRIDLVTALGRLMLQVCELFTCIWLQDQFSEQHDLGKCAGEQRDLCLKV